MMNDFITCVRRLVNKEHSSKFPASQDHGSESLNALELEIEARLAGMTPMERIRIRSRLRHQNQLERIRQTLQRRMQERRRYEAQRRCARAHLRRLLRRLERLERLLEEYGTPPASKDTIEKLPSVAITKVHNGYNCSVCVEDLQEDEVVLKLPCEHLFHKICIVPWLELHNTCPVCRNGLVENDGPTEQSENMNAGV